MPLHTITTQPGPNNIHPADVGNTRQINNNLVITAARGYSEQIHSHPGRGRMAGPHQRMANGRNRALSVDSARIAVSLGHHSGR